MTLINRAARALCVKESGTDCFDSLDEPAQHNLMERVRVVLEAAREPDGLMEEAGAEIVRYVHSEESEAAFEDDAANVWRAMLDAAMAER